MKVIKDKNNRIFVIPNVEKPIKIVFQDRYNIEETTNGLIITERISLQNDSTTFETHISIILL